MRPATLQLAGRGWLGPELRRPLLAGGGLLLLIAAGLAVHRPGAGNPGSEARQAAFAGIGVLACLAYFAAVAWVRRGPLPRRVLSLVLAVAIGMRLIALAGPPFLSTDLFRYIWDGRVQSVGINPYLMVPTDPTLRSLRDGVIFPQINRGDYARTIYPPAAELLFRLITSVSETPLAMKLTMLGFDLLAIGVMLRLLALARLERGRVLIYAWNPLTVWEFAGNGHVDAVVVGCVALAMLAYCAGRQMLVGTAMTVAILVKFLPAALLPAFWRPRQGRAWRLPLTVLALTLLFYSLYIGAGSRVLGFLSGYASEEHLDSGSGIYWLDLIGRFVPLPAQAGRIWLAAAALGLAGLGLAMLLRDRAPSLRRHPVPLARDLCVMGTAVLATVTPHYSWYFVWLALPACLAAYPSVVFLSAIPILQYYDPFRDPLLQFSFIYVPFAWLALRDLGRPPVPILPIAPLPTASPLRQPVPSRSL